jgi:hypothetical protein
MPETIGRPLKLDAVLAMRTLLGPGIERPTLASEPKRSRKRSDPTVGIRQAF